MKCKALAMVIGDTIHLSGVSQKEFLKDEEWLRHELVHIKQYRRYGKWRFLMTYFWESLRKGYVNNRLEVEAREQKDKIQIENFQLRLPGTKK